MNCFKHLLGLVFLLIAASCSPEKKENEREIPPPQSSRTEQKRPKLRLGAERTEAYLPLLEGKRIAPAVNQTSLVGDKHLVDILLDNKLTISKIFAPEHGFRGTADAGEKVETAKDSGTGLPIVSLYGKNLKPSADQLSDVDAVIFDIQDVGSRFYTYISTMHYLMEACAENGKELIVLDRPNPNGHFVDGPVREKGLKSFVGMHPIPVVHGLTVGELAKMINGEGWLAGGLRCNLTVIPCTTYSHSDRYSLPVRPSPNLPNDRAIALYPSLCLFEGTPVSVGRGTDWPFQVIGAPFYADTAFSFRPESRPGAKYPPHQNALCFGKDFREAGSGPVGFSLAEVIEFYNQSPEKDQFFKPFFDKLVGNRRIALQIRAGRTEKEIGESWAEEVDKYKLMRKKYLLYPDFE